MKKFEAWRTDTHERWIDAANIFGAQLFIICLCLLGRKTLFGAAKQLRQCPKPQTVHHRKKLERSKAI